jgi:UDP-N-acetylglucosamine/UDP-N-acetylgalactosamine diphosphorylase
MVGPVRLDYGITVAAGTIVRKDELRADRLIFGGASKGGNIEFRPGQFGVGSRIIRNNLVYIGNLLALAQWHRQVRSLFVGRRFPDSLLAGLAATLQAAVAERMRRLKDYAERAAAADSPALNERWPAVEEAVCSQRDGQGDPRLRESFQESVSASIATIGKDYIAVVKALAPEAAGQGTLWLQGIVDETVKEALAAMANS